MSVYSNEALLMDTGISMSSNFYMSCKSFLIFCSTIKKNVKALFFAGVVPRQEVGQTWPADQSLLTLSMNKFQGCRGASCARQGNQHEFVPGWYIYLRGQWEPGTSSTDCSCGKLRSLFRKICWDLLRNVSLLVQEMLVVFGADIWLEPMRHLQAGLSLSRFCT